LTVLMVRAGIKDRTIGRRDHLGRRLGCRTAGTAIFRGSYHRFQQGPSPTPEGTGFQR
jgi:hypothetical protein